MCFAKTVSNVVILLGCGMKIRSDDPTSMKNFIISVQNRVNDLKFSPEDGQKGINSKRVSVYCIYTSKSNAVSSSCFRAKYLNVLWFRWSLCLKPYAISRITRGRLRRILCPILG